MKKYFLIFLFLAVTYGNPTINYKKSLKSLKFSSEIEKIARDNYKPIIAIISIPHKKRMPSVLSTDIVRFIEEGGARVLPIHYKTPWETVKNILSHVNGFVFQGGGPMYWPKKEVVDHFNLQWKVYQWAMEENMKKEGFFPILGVCLGFQRLIELSALWNEGKQGFLADSTEDVYKIRDEYFGLYRVESEFHPSNMELVEKTSVLFNGTAEIIEKFNINDTKKLFFLNNKLGINETRLKNDKNLNETWKIIGRSQDFEGKWFITAIEHNKFPFFGLQIHPEKIQFDSNDYVIKMSEEGRLHYIPSNQESITINSKIAINFVEECKKNKNYFEKSKDFEPKLIDNYKAYIHRGGDINSYYAIEEGFLDFKDMQTVFPQVHINKKGKKNTLFKGD